MARRHRPDIPGVPLHVWQRGVDRDACFRDDADRRLYLGLLEEFSIERHCAVHAYVLMTNHVHLLFTPWDAGGCSRFMKDVTQRYSQHCNRAWKRTGPLWDGRFKASLVDSQTYLLTCHRYVEMNPVRANMVEHPGDYAWSSFRTNALGIKSALITPHALLRGMAPDDAGRCRAYRELFDTAPTAQELHHLREATRSGAPLGSATFIAEMEKCGGKRYWTRKARSAKAQGAPTWCETGSDPGQSPGE